jgi:cobyrinic acid a,c-diamide synthase
MSNYPRVIIAGTHSSVGKTIVTIGIMAALKQKGYKVQPFKTGPDYIDPLYHSWVVGTKSRNLDTWLLSKEVIFESIMHTAQKADISIIEGVMGLYDGFNNSEEGSTAHLAKILRAPIILVVDAKGMSRSVAAMVLGFVQFNPKVDIVGVIFNKVGSQKHYEYLRDAVKDKCGNIEVLGYLPKDKSLDIREQHLGLPIIDRDSLLGGLIPPLAEKIVKYINLDMIIKIAREAPALPGYIPTIFPEIVQSGKVSIGVAMDDAFCFYYEDNLNILQHLGAEIVYFSPLDDIQLPIVDGLYFGGGFPELFADKLEANISMRTWIMHASNLGMPIYAECGGMLYLLEKIISFDGKTSHMVGLIKGYAKMGERLNKLGYCTATILEDNILANKGDVIRGHRFHWSILENTPEPNAYQLNDNEKAGFIKPNLLASYLHIHFGSQRRLAENFIKSCSQYKEIRRKNRIKRW